MRNLPLLKLCPFHLSVHSRRGTAMIEASLVLPLIILSVLTCILIGWVVKPKYVEEEVLVSQPAFRARLLLSVMLRYVCPVCMIIILLTPFVTEI